MHKWGDGKRGIAEMRDVNLPGPIRFSTFVTVVRFNPRLMSGVKCRSLSFAGNGKDKIIQVKIKRLIQKKALSSSNYV